MLKGNPMARKIFKVEHPLKCSCGADLTKLGSIMVSFLCANHPIDNYPSQVDRKGILEDTEDGLIANGNHAGSWCDACGAIIEEL